jgi:hypothetical protein
MADNESLNISIGSDPSGVEKGSRKAKTAVKSVVDEAKQLDQAFRRIKTAVDPTFAATDKYNKALADNKRLLAAGRIDRAEYLANTKALKAALDQQTQSIQRTSAAGRAAAAQAKADAAAERQAKKASLEADRLAARQAAQEKIAASRAASRAAEEAHRREQLAIRASAQAARQAATEARRFSSSSGSGTRGVAPGSIPTNRTTKQLEYDVQRAMDASTRAAQKAMDLAARAAEASSSRVATSLKNQAERSKQAAEDYSNRAIQLNRTLTSEQGRLSQEAAAEVRAAKQSERAAIREAAQEARQAAQARRIADRDAARGAREAAEATERQAAAERRAAIAANELRSSIDPVFAAQQRYNQVMQQATQLLMMNKLQTGEWTKIQQQAKAQMDVNVRSMGRMNSVYVQMGYQAQDVTASLASGIHPLVILAQQGGQTASALAQMGGTVGRVAAFMAGPWGAAIIGFTMLIGLMIDKKKEAKAVTLDLTNAEEVRTAKLADLKKALQDFNAEQERANTNSREALELDRQRAGIGYADAQTRVQTARDELEKAKKAYEEASRNASTASMGIAGEAARGQLMAAQGRLKSAQNTLTLAEETLALARKAQQQVEIRTVRGRAEAQVDPRAAIRNTYEDEETRLQRIYERETALLDPQRDQVALAQAQGRLQEGLAAAAKVREAAEKKLRDAAKETNNAYGEGVAVFKSRAQAIQMAGRELQQQGLRVSENALFGGVTSGAHSSSHQNAIDVNVGTGVNESADPGTSARFDAIARSYQSRGYRVLWNGRVYEAGGNGPGALITKKGKGDWQHKQHMHLEAPGSIVGKPTQASTGAQAARDNTDVIQSYIEDLEYLQQQADENYQEQLVLQDKKISALKAFYGEESREAIRGQRERLAIEKRMNQSLLAEQRSAIQERLSAAESEADTAAQVAAIAREQASDNAGFNAGNGLVSEREAILGRARMLDQEYQDNVAHERKLFELRAQAVRDQLALANLSVEQRRQLMGQLAAIERTHQAQGVIAAAQYQRDVNAMGNEMANLYAQKWREVATTVTGSLSSAFQSLWTHSQTFSEAMIQMADQLVYKFFDMGMKMVENWIMSQFTKKAVTQASAAQEAAAVVGSQATQTAAVIGGEAARTGAVLASAATEQGITTATTAAAVAGEGIKSAAAVAGAATSTTATAAAGMANITTSAAESAAGAFKSTVVIPFIGPVSAPAAAALALATVLGFGAMISARGGQAQVPYDGQLTELHKDEMVLPAWAATPLRQQLRTPSSGGIAGAAAVAGNSLRSSVVNGSKDLNFTYSPTIPGGYSPDLDTLLTKDSASMRRWLRKEIKRNSLSLKGA